MNIETGMKIIHILQPSKVLFQTNTPSILIFIQQTKVQSSSKAESVYHWMQTI